MSERKEPTVSSVLNAKEELSDRRAQGARQRTTQASTKARPKASKQVVVESQYSPGFAWLTFFMTLMAVVVAGYAVWELKTTAQIMKGQSLRIVQLENQLALSDDSANQSLTTVSAKVRELNVKAAKAESEIDKLWATRNVNRTAIADADKKISSLQKTQKTVTQLATTLDGVEKSVSALNPLKASLASTLQSVGEQELLLQSTRERVSMQGDSLKSLSAQVKKNTAASKRVSGIDKRVNNTEEAITSFDAFRRTVNRDLLQLKQVKK